MPEIRKGDLPDVHPKPQMDQMHPAALQADLNPNRMQGQNVGAGAGDVNPGVTNASHVKKLTRNLDGFTKDELTQIPVLPDGARLKQGAVYVDLVDPERDPFTAEGNDVVPPGRAVVPKAETPYMYWNRLLGIEDATRST